MTLQLADPTVLAAWLLERGLASSPVRAVEPAGAGNMNRVLRVTLAGGASLILKQALPWVAKYPDIAAPIERAASEAAFYAAIEPVPALRQHTPRVLHFDPNNYVLVLEDLGAASDLTDLYAGARLTDAEAGVLLGWLATLHNTPFATHAWPALENRAMRVLNHAHIFEIPFADPPALDLDGVTPGLAEAARQLRADAPLRAAARRLGDVYLAPAGAPGHLLHGDFYPGGWLRHPQRGLIVIDPEFGFFGPPEFDLGVFRAHLLLAGSTSTQIDTWLQSYQAPAGFSAELARGFAGIEIIRRLLGVAQLPVVQDLAGKRALLATARELLR